MGLAVDEDVSVQNFHVHYTTRLDWRLEISIEKTEQQDLTENDGGKMNQCKEYKHLVKVSQEGTLMIEPVSYTHLDVYKRQPNW